MTRDQAAERVAAMAAADINPTIDTDTILALVDDAARADYLGHGPQDAGWEPTYDLNAAAADAWRLKAGLAAAQYSVTTDGATFQRNQIQEHCLAMATHYAARVTNDALADKDRDLLHYDGGELLP